MGKLFVRVCSTSTLRQAWKEIERKGAHGGIDGVSVEEFARDAAKHLDELARMLWDGRYSPEPADRIHVPKFNEAREMRPLSLPAVKDKVVQQAVRKVIEPFFEERFLPCSYAYRPGKGHRRAVGKVIHYICSEKREWAVFGDMDNFFDSLDHELLLAEVKQVVDDPQILGLIRMWMKIGAMDQRGRYHDMELGVAQGGIISPLLSNIYAHPLDRHVVAMNPAYVRYADNFITLCSSREEAERNLEAIVQFIQGTLRLRLNPEKEPVRSLQDGFVFLGVHFRGKDRFLAQEKKDKLRRKIDWITMRSRPHHSEKVIRELAEAVDGARRHYAFLNPVFDFRDLDRYLIFRLKGLFRFRRERGSLKNRSELNLLVDKLPFFAATDEKAARALRKALVSEVFEQVDGKAVGKSEQGKVPIPHGRAPMVSLRHGETGAGVSPSVLSADRVGEVVVCPPELPGATPEPARAVPAGEHPDPPAGADSSASGSEVPWGDASSRVALPSKVHGNGVETSGSTAGESSAGSTLGKLTCEEAGQETQVSRSADRKVASKKQRYIRTGFVSSEVVIQTPGTFVGYRGNRMVVYCSRKKVKALPVNKIKSISIESFGVTVSSDLIKACVKADVPIVFSSPGGRSYATVHTPLQSKPDLSLLQLEAVRNGTALKWAKAFVYGKLRNQLNLLKFYLRHREDQDPVYAKKMQQVEGPLLEIQKKVKSMEVQLPYDDVRNQLFGYEGQAGAIYWETVQVLLPKSTGFIGRVSQGAKDLVNACLNYGYALLYPRMERALLLAGLNLYTGLLHAPQVGKPTLSFDLIETFRAPVVDRAVFSLLTRGRDLRLTKVGFLDESSKRLITEAVVGRLGTLVPYRGEKLLLDQVIHKQARLLARSLREEKRYSPFISRY